MATFGLPLLLDKSSLQSLNYQSLETLSHNYLLVLPPILFREIIGDLYSNETKNGSTEGALNTHLVQTLARKIFTHSAVRNVDWEDLCIQELLGHNVSSNFRPCVAPTKLKRNGVGHAAALIDNETEMAMIRDWQNGIFTDKDATYAKEFRTLTRQKDLSQIAIKFGEMPEFFKGSSLGELQTKILGAVRNAENQWFFVNGFCDILQIPLAERANIHRRFIKHSSSFEKFAP
jgi:hypothetical protein